jgi:ketosteroid isomerase-like protein
VLAAAASLVDAFARHDPTAYFAHFAADATFVFYTVGRVLRSRHEYEVVWREWESGEGFRVRACRSVDPSVRVIDGSAAVFTHEVSTTVETLRGAETLAERETIVFERMGGRWLAVHEHLSPLPAA